jgi:hypothetical protein
MNKKEIIIPFVAIGLALAFVLVSLAVFMSNGKSKKWIARKIKIGALLLTLTAASCTGGGGEVTCYEVAEINGMYINPTSNEGIEIRLDTGNTIIGNISSIEGKDFSFQISDSLGTKFQKGILLFDNDSVEYSKDFKVELSKDLKPGKYSLKLFDKAIEKQDSVEPKRSFNLIIEN